jgi:ammonia channel protein AmtB
LYFLISGFWTNVGISGVNKSLNWGSRVPVYLTDSNSINTATYGNTAIQAFKCSLANSIAFAAISGRAGPLEAFFISLVGTIAYELNRQLVSRYSFDFGGTMTIFCFGGFLGSTISLFLYYCKQIKTFEKHELRYSGKFSYFFVAIGSLFCWVFFPFLNIDIPISLVYNYSAGLNTFYCISACVVTSISLTCIINGKLDLKDVILSPVAGGVAAGSSAAIINDTLSALLLGIGASVMLISLLQLDKLIRWRIVVENYVFYLYAIIGACAGFASAIFSYESTSDSNYNFSSSSYATNFSLPVYYNQFIGVGISAGIGIVGGLILSPLICLINVETRLDHYHDRSYWIIEKDGIS